MQIHSFVLPLFYIVYQGFSYLLDWYYYTLNVVSIFMYFLILSNIVGIHQCSILDSTLFLILVNYVPNHVISNSAVYACDTTPYSKYNEVSDLWQ